MDEKDKQIEKLFDDYGSSLKPNERLADSALRKMRDKKSKPKKSRAPVWIGVASACAAVAITVFSVMSFWDGADVPSSGGHGVEGDASVGNRPAPPETDPPSAPSPVYSYSISDLRETKVDNSFAVDYIDTSGLTDAQIIGENYYAYYLKKTDEFVYFKAEFSISCNDGNIQMRIIAESSAFKGEELIQQYDSVMHGKDYEHRTENKNGEYTTIAYCKQNVYKYYVSAVGDTDGAENIAAKIIGIES